ncbi:MAG: PadR family transcriptional regulator [Clostridia bacterium]|nr:PadR family transcriptional regulator [Clostridia bacterium]
MLDAQVKRGFLEMCVLAALYRRESYGYKIIKDLSCCIEISESTLYPILRRLESSGSLNVYSEEHNGRLRKMYRITEAGRCNARDFLKSRAMVDSMYDFMEEEIGDE